MIRDPRQQAMLASVLIALLMLVGKTTAYLLTNSSALLADAAESVIHGVATAFAAFSLWYADRPADAHHPYGHGRIVYFSAGVEGMLVLAASIAVIYSGVMGLIHGPQLQHLGLGLIIATSLALINLGLGLTLRSIGKRHHSVILIANGTHVLTDVWTTGAAVLGLTLVMVTGVSWVDPAVAIVLGTWIMISGITLVRQSFSGLMDKVNPTLMSRLTDLLHTTVREGLITEFHALRVRRLNDAILVEVHLRVPGTTSVTEAHVRATNVEEHIQRLFPAQRVHVTSHIEPHESHAHMTGIQID